MIILREALLTDTNAVAGLGIIFYECGSFLESQQFKLLHLPGGALLEVLRIGVEKPATVREFRTCRLAACQQQKERRGQ